MSIPGRSSTSLASLFFVILAVAIWAAVGPTQLGGQSSFILVSGSSMEPAFHDGDLVIVRPDSSYVTGDILAYRNLDLGNNVLHRIIGQDQDRLILKGDNNSWIDSYHPLPQDLIGKLWIAVPGAGKWIQTLRQPGNFALAVGALAAFIALGGAGERARRRSTGKRLNLPGWLTARVPNGARTDGTVRASPVDKRNAASPGGRGPMAGSVQAIGSILEFVLLASLVLGLIAFILPAAKSLPQEMKFGHAGIFTYSGSAPALVYGSTGLQPPSPIFPKVTCQVSVRFGYVLALPQPSATIAGSYALLGVLAEPISGWQRTFTLVPETQFSGRSFSAQAPLDVCQVDALIDQVETQTGFHAGMYTLSLNPSVRVSGELSGSHLDETFAPKLLFNYDRTRYSVVRDDPQIDPLNPTQMGFVRTFRTVPNTVSVFHLDLSVPAMRGVSIVGLLLSALGLLGLARYLRNLQHHDPQAFVRARYAPLLIGIQDENLIQQSPIVEVASIDDLARLADRNGGAMLHAAGGEEYYYYIDGKGVTYRYRNQWQAEAKLAEINAAPALAAAGGEQQLDVIDGEDVTYRDGKPDRAETVMLSKFMSSKGREEERS